MCIVQDDDEDWLRQAAKMSEYYRNSVLTIAADDAKNSDEDLFQPRPPDAVHSASLGLYAFPDGSRRDLSVR